MKSLFLRSAAALVLLGLASPALAQTTNALVGQNPNGQISASAFANNTDTTGFNDTSLNAAIVVPSTSTAQATFNSQLSGVLSGTVIQNRTNVITTCSGTTGVTLPAVNKYVAISILNRSGGSCLVWPSIGATVETAIGTNGAVNAPATVLTNTDTVFRPVSATSWLQ